MTARIVRQTTRQKGSGSPGRERLVAITSTETPASPAVDALHIETDQGSRRFSKERRVRRRLDFQRVFERGTRVHGRYFTFILLPNGAPLPRLGLVASRKFGGSVERNRAKRLIREMFRNQLPEAGGFAVDLVVIPRRELLDVPFPTLEGEFRDLWRRAASRTGSPARGRG